MVRLGALVVVALILGSAVFVTSRDRSEAGGGGCRVAMTDQPATSVDASHYCFGPIVARIEVGDTVTWTNRDDAMHNVFSVGGEWGWDSNLVPRVGTFSATFTTAGVFPYVCTIHPSMAGVVVVGDGRGVLAPYQPDISQYSAQVATSSAVSAPSNPPSSSSAPVAAAITPDNDGDGGMLLAFAGLATVGSIAAVGAIAGVRIARRR